MSIPQILQQLGGNKAASPMMQQIKQMASTVKLAQNPQMALNQLIQNNPQMKQVMQIVNMSGKSPEQVFYALAERKGVNPQEILNELKQAF